MLTGAERSMHAPVVIADELLEFWGRVYQENPRLAARGVSFESFLGRPWWYLVEASPRALVTVCGPVNERTLTALRALAEHATRGLERVGARCSNGRFVEKLRHHRHPRSYRDFAVKVEM